MERSNQQGAVTVHAFNSFFYPKLIKSGYASLKRWTKKVGDMFAASHALPNVGHLVVTQRSCLLVGASK